MTRHYGHVVDRNTGAEGPSHDPYGWEELIVNRFGKTFTYRIGGLGYVRVVVDKEKVFEGQDEGPELMQANDLFRELTGFTPTQWERIERKLSSRCKRCGGKNFGYMAGYPGETIKVCLKCDVINPGGWFNESAII